MSSRKNVVEFPDAGSIEEEAGAWVARMDTRALAQSERAALAEWLKRSPLHREALERMSAIWGDLDVLDELNLIEPLDEEEGKIRILMSRRLWIGAALAASLLLAVGIGGQMAGWFIRTQTAAFATDIGQQKTIELVDGSVIVLNTNSEIEVDLERHSRSVRLLRGEAHFAVAKDRDRPFFVSARDGLIKAVGTAFAVHLREKDVEVTVSEGVVELLALPGNVPGQLPLLADLPIKQKEFAPLAALTANESAQFDKKVERIETLSKEAVNKKLLWREGLIGFRGEPLSAVIAEVSRYTNIKIEIEDPALRNTPIGGFFVVGDVEGLFQALQAVFHIEVHRVNALEVKLTRQS